MTKINFLKVFSLFVATIGITLGTGALHAQRLFSVTQNNLPQENLSQLIHEAESLEITTLSLMKNNNNKDIYPVALSPAQNTQIIILNEQNGAHVVITPAVETRWIASLQPAEFQLAPFFIEELKQGVLGDANRYLLIEVTPDFSVKNLASIPASFGNVLIPRFLYGKKESVQEALPQDRQIISIYKQKPQIISEFPDDPLYQSDIAKLAEAMSYYVYTYKLPDGTLATYDEHFSNDNEKSSDEIGDFLKFNLYGALNETQRLATEFALELWSYQLGGTVIVDIGVNFIPLGQGVLGMSYFPPSYLDTETHTWFPSALWNQMVGYDAFETEGDINIVMNSDYKFYFGLDGATTQIDYVTIMIHEATHGLGFFSTCAPDGFFWGEYPGIFDRQLFQGLTGPCITDISESERAALIISSNLYAGAPGSHLLNANNGVRVKMYAPYYYSSGSSTHHWDSNVSFPTFMKYAYASPLHTFNDRKMGVFMDMGWRAPEIDPNTVFVNFHPNSGVGQRPPQPFLPNVPQDLKMNVFGKSGYHLFKWNTKPDGSGDAYEEKENIVIDEDLDLYAQWDNNDYTLTFYVFGGTVSPTAKQVTFNKPIGELPIPVKEGYIFKEWKISTRPINENTIWNFTMDLIAGAKWEMIQSIPDNPQKPTLQMIPNPATHSVELRMMNDELEMGIIEFYNLFGQLVKIIPVNGVEYKKIDISDLHSGVYVVKVGYQTMKLVVY